MVSLVAIAIIASESRGFITYDGSTHTRDTSSDISTRWEDASPDEFDRSFADWSLSGTGIPAGSVLTQARLLVSVQTGSASAMRFRRRSTRANVATDQQIFDESSSGTDHSGSVTLSLASPTAVTLNSTARADIQTQLAASGWYGLGCRFNAEVTTTKQVICYREDEESPDYQHKLELTYTAPPAAQATDLRLDSDAAPVTFESAALAWTRGGGDRVAVFVKAASSGAPDPETGTTYAANAAFGSGGQIGTSGWYCVYDGTGTQVTVSALSPATAYRVCVLEYATGGAWHEDAAGSNIGNITTPVQSTGMGVEAEWVFQSGPGAGGGRDSTMDEFSPNANEGESAVQPTRLGRYPITTDLRPILLAPLSAFPGAAGTIVSATLTLPFISGAAGGTTDSTLLRRVTQANWTEGGVTWNNYAAGSAWTTAGGDISGTPLPVGFVPPDASDLVIDVTALMVHAVTNGLDLNALMDPALGTTWERFYGNRERTNPSQRWRLSVVWNATAPPDQARLIVANNITSDSVLLRWTEPVSAVAPEGYLVWIKPSGSGFPAPVDSDTYSDGGAIYAGNHPHHRNTYPGGDALDGWRCVLNTYGLDTDLTLLLDGLTAGTTYRVAVTAFNGSPGAEHYNTDDSEELNPIDFSVPFASGALVSADPMIFESGGRILRIRPRGARPRTQR